MSYSQYGEEAIILEFFNNSKNGFLVDVGAADGVRYSNSRHLIEHLGWKGILVEPHPTYYKQLSELYSNAADIMLLNVAAGSAGGQAPFYLFGHDEHAQVSTLSAEFKNKVIQCHGNRYEAEPLMVNVLTLESILSKAPQVNFLSVDCEGVDMDVLKSNDWKKYRPDLVCVEHSMPMHELVSYMDSAKYRFVTSNVGNAFFAAIK